MNTPLIILAVLVVLGGIVVLLDHLHFGTEAYSISTRDLPNIAAAMADPDEATIRVGARS